MRRECDCKQPEPHVKPGKQNWCVKCGGYLADHWRSSNANVAQFFNRLSDCQNVEGTFPAFRAQCERRELAGRSTFRYKYLSRDNIADGFEEACDLALYPYLDALKAQREGLGDEDIDLCLQVAFYAAMAYDTLARLRAKRDHAP